MIKIGFDIGGVLSKYPDIFRPMVHALVAGGAEVHVLTDMHKRDETLSMLRGNEFIPPILEEHVHNSDFETYGESCKAVLLRDLKIDMFMDDFPAYVASGCPVRLLVLPDLSRPYYHDSWITSGTEGEFGRRCKVNRFLHSGW